MSRGEQSEWEFEWEDKEWPLGVRFEGGFVNVPPSRFAHHAEVEWAILSR